MFRATILLIVLMVGLGQDTLLLCKVWCDPVEAARAGCHQEDASTSPVVTGSENCGPEALRSAVLAREDLRRSMSDQGARHAVVIPRYQLSVSLTGVRPGSDPGRASPVNLDLSCTPAESESRPSPPVDLTARSIPHSWRAPAHPFAWAVTTQI